MKLNNFIKLGFAIACVSQMYAKVHHVGSESDFNSLVGNGTAALVKFEAQWCGPCKKSAPIFEQMAEKHPEVTFISVDIDKVKSLANKHKIGSVPTLVVFDGSGKKVQTLNSGFNTSEIIAAIKPFEGQKKNNDTVKAKPEPKKEAAKPEATKKAEQPVKKQEPKKEVPVKTESTATKKCAKGTGVTDIKDNDHLNDIIKGGGIVVAKFEADWCTPCKDAKEPLGYIVNDYPDVTFVSIDIDNNKDIQNSLVITSVPTFVIFKNGKEIDRLVSFFDPALRAKIDDAKTGKKSALAQVKYTSKPAVS